MFSLITVGQIFLALLLVSVILLQGRGAGLSSSFSGIGQTFHTRRGMEKVLYFLTIFLAVFLILTILIAVAS